MNVENIIQEKPVKVTNNGMITIPASLRKKYDLKDGDKVLVLEDEGSLRIVPIRDESDLRKNTYSTKEMKEISRKIREDELERESL